MPVMARGDYPAGKYHDCHIVMTKAFNNVIIVVHNQVVGGYDARKPNYVQMPFGKHSRTAFIIHFGDANGFDTAL